MTEGADPPDSTVSYSLKTVVSSTGVARETLIEYCEHGLLPVTAELVEDTQYDDEIIGLIRRVENLRTIHGVNLAGIQMILDLTNEVENLRRELKFRVDADH
jgi:DNA-binding transcriptional MerR regulator